jgi:hypothetical protein
MHNLIKLTKMSEKQIILISHERRNFIVSKKVDQECLQMRQEDSPKTDTPRKLILIEMG